MKQFRLPAAVVATFALAAIALNAVLSATSADVGRDHRGPTPRGLPPHAAALVADAADGAIYYGDDEHRRLPIASTTKLMTALRDARAASRSTPSSPRRRTTVTAASR